MFAPCKQMTQEMHVWVRGRVRPKGNLQMVLEMQLSLLHGFTGLNGMQIVPSHLSGRAQKLVLLGGGLCPNSWQVSCRLHCVL